MTKLSSFRDPVVRTELNTPSELRQGPATAWITAPYRLSVLAACWMLYPPLILSLRSLLSPATLTGVMNAGGMPGDGLPLDAGAITSGFAPAISLLYGAWLGLTFNILEGRLGELRRRDAPRFTEITPEIARGQARRAAAHGDQRGLRARRPRAPDGDAAWARREVVRRCVVGGGRGESEITRDCSRSPLAHVRASDTAIDSLSVNQSVSSSASTKPAGQSNGPKLPASAFATISARPAPAADTMTHFAAFITSSEIATKSPSARASLPASTTWNEQCRGANNNNDAGEGNSNDDNHKHSDNSNQS